MRVRQDVVYLQSLVLLLFFASYLAYYITYITVNVFYNALCMQLQKSLFFPIADHIPHILVKNSYTLCLPMPSVVTHCWLHYSSVLTFGYKAS